MKSRIALLSSCLWVQACTNPSEPSDTAVVVVSPDPDSVEGTNTAITGRVYDYFTGDPLVNAFVSTFPAAEVLRTNRDGRYILSREISEGRLYEIHAEADGYQRAVHALQARPGRNDDVDLPLVSTDRAVPVRVEPPVLVLTSDLHEGSLVFTNDAPGELVLSFETPPWLTVVSTQRALAGGERRALRFGIEPEAFAEAVAAAPEGQSLGGTILVRDGFERVLLVQVVAVPAPPGTVRLTLEGERRRATPVARTLAIVASARYAALPLAGASVAVLAEGDLEVQNARPVTDEEGRVVVTVTALSPGKHAVRLSLPTYPDAEAVEVLIDAEAEAGPADANPCAPDVSGQNACGEAARWRCTVDLDGEAVCEAIDRCAPDARGRNVCGEAAFWRCVDGPESPECEDIDECQVANGGCGSARWSRCVNREGAPPLC